MVCLVDWPLLRFPSLGDGESKVFRHTKGFNVPLVGRWWKSLKKQLWEGHRRAERGAVNRWEAAKGSHTAISSHGLYHVIWSSHPHSFGSHPKAQNLLYTAPSNPTGLLFWWQIFGLQSHNLQKENPYKSQSLFCVTPSRAGLRRETTEISNQVKWYME